MTKTRLPFDWTQFENELLDRVTAAAAFTAWLPRATPPLADRPGVYQVTSPSGIAGWSWWNGSHFGGSYVHISGALTMREHGLRTNDDGDASISLIRSWRGCLEVITS